MSIVNCKQIVWFSDSHNKYNPTFLRYSIIDSYLGDIILWWVHERHIVISDFPRFPDDTSNTTRPELSAHSEAIALKWAEDAKRMADQQQLEEQNSAPSGAQSLSFYQTEAVNVHAVTPAKWSRDEYKLEDLS